MDVEPSEALDIRIVAEGVATLAVKLDRRI